MRRFRSSGFVPCEADTETDEEEDMLFQNVSLVNTWDGTDALRLII
jgi:hypothetical protein